MKRNFSTKFNSLNTRDGGEGGNSTLIVTRTWSPRINQKLLRIVDQFLVRRTLLDQVSGDFRTMERQLRQIALLFLGEHVVDHPIRAHRVGEKRVPALFDFFHAHVGRQVFRFRFNLLVYDFLHVRINLAVFLYVCKRLSVTLSNRSASCTLCIKLSIVFLPCMFGGITT